MSDCIFCKIADGTIPAKLLHQDDHVVAFADLHPQAPTHVLIVPRRHVASLDGLDDVELGGRLLAAAVQLARTLGVAEGGYRVVANTGADAGQSVHHLHFHLLGGRALAWPPG